jgi:LysM repeat protein/ABC-type branched-subunit amino acid transport system substrate-binding protein
LKTLGIFLLLSTCMLVSAQMQPVEVKRTQEKTIVNGKVYYIHTIQKGQTLYSISKAYEVSQEEIMRENPGMDPAALKEGQALRIPSSGSNQASVIASNKIAYPENKEDFIDHKVKKGQTVYSLSKKYEVDEDVIYRYNPWARDGIQPGQTIWIPKPKKVQISTTEAMSGFRYHTVKEQETLYSISVIYGLSVSDIIDNNDFLRDGLKAGEVLKIPAAPDKTKEMVQVDSAPAGMPCTPVTDDQAVYNVALLLPFFSQMINEEIGTPSDSIAEEGTYVPLQRQQGLRGKSFAEFYEGFLLAVDSMKSNGLSVNLHTYDTERDTMKVKKIVRDLSLIRPDLIIGPVWSEDVRIAGRLAKNSEINLVSPLSNRTSLVDKNSRIIQVIPSREAECRSLAQYISHLKKGHLFLLHGTDSVSMHGALLFRKYLQEQMPLSENNTPLELRNYKLNDSLLTNISKVLTQQDENIVIVFSESEPDVSRLMTKLFMMSSLYPIMVFGMPSWQSWKTIELNYFHHLQLHLISPFYIDYNNAEVKEFLEKCRRAYGYEPYETSALGYNFCMLGYDVGLYFLSALKNYGKDFQNCLGSMDTRLLLSPYRYSQEGLGGYINQGFNMIRYNPDFTITTEQLEK